MSEPTPDNLIDIADNLPIWDTSRARCLACGRRWVAVHVWWEASCLECPGCGERRTAAVRIG